MQMHFSTISSLPETAEQTKDSKILSFLRHSLHTIGKLKGQGSSLDTAIPDE